MKTSMPDCGVEPFTLDYTDFYDEHELDVGTDLITSSTWVVTNGTGSGDFVNTPKTTITLSGATLGITIVAKNTIEINGGALKTCATLYVDIF